MTTPLAIIILIVIIIHFMVYRNDLERHKNITAFVIGITIGHLLVNIFTGKHFNG